MVIERGIRQVIKGLTAGFTIYRNNHRTAPASSKGLLVKEINNSAGGKYSDIVIADNDVYENGFVEGNPVSNTIGIHLDNAMCPYLSGKIELADRGWESSSTPFLMQLCKTTILPVWKRSRRKRNYDVRKPVVLSSRQSNPFSYGTKQFFKRDFDNCVNFTTSVSQPDHHRQYHWRFV
ncbi:hypothetical protein [Paenibacillus sp. GCM10012303]|uniref:hypothetical protein n=1 Tax=Paenibacillus sp. GCM10012303 TaxID=3317340 RepID=UPI0036D2C887